MIYISIAIILLLVLTIYNWIRVDRLEKIEKELLRRYDNLDRKFEELENKSYLVRELLEADNG